MEKALEHHEIFVFMDNSVFEGCYSKGHSTSEELSDIVFHLHKAERDRASFFVCFIYRARG